MERGVKNLAIRASAGTGKTYELAVQFIVRLVAGASPADILATTFTRKAAGEILSRILSRVAGASLGGTALENLNTDLRRVWRERRVDYQPLSLEDCRALLGRMCRYLHRFHVSTIDALFVRTLGVFLLEAGTADLPAMTDDASAEIRRARTRAMETVLARLARDEVLSMLDALVGNKSVRTVARRMDDVVAALHYLFRTAPTDAWDTLVVPGAPPDLDAALVRMPALANEVEDSSLGQALRVLESRVRERDWSAVLEAQIVKSVLTGDATYYRKPMPSQVVEVLRTIAEASTHHVLAAVKHKTLGMRQLLEAFSPAYLLSLRDQNLLPFSELPILVGSVLETLDNQDLAYRLDMNPSHLLLDEFQDTNLEQWQVLRRMFRLHDGHQADARPSSVFCVGDTKQAIYGWRGGCAAIFERIDEDLPAVVWDSRHTSYRSSQTVLDFVDTVFTNLRADPDLAKFEAVLRQWESHYERHMAFHKDLTGYVEVCFAPDATREALDDEDGGNDANGDPASAAPGYEVWVAHRVAELHQTHPGASIGILMRTNKAADVLALALQSLGLPASQEGPGVLCDDPAVDLVVSAMHLADHPGSTAEAFHVYHSPLRDLLHFQDRSLQTCERVSLALRRRLATHGYGDTVAWLAAALAEYGDRRTSYRLTQLVEAADEYDRRAGTRPADFVEWLLSTTVTDSVPAPIRIMSIHQSKGLEFDIVVLPQLHHPIGATPPSVLVVRRGETGPVQEIHAYAGGAIQAVSRQLQDAYRQHASRELQDALNLLYVAMTRARRGLHVFMPARKLKKNGEPTKLRLSAQSILLSALQQPGAASGTVYRAGTWDWDTPAHERTPRSLEPTDVWPTRIRFNTARPLRMWPEASPSAAGGAHVVRPVEIFRLDTAARDRGSVLHAWLQRVSWLDEPLPTDIELLTIGNAIAPRKDRAWFLELAEDFRRKLQQPNTASVLARPQGEVLLQREQPFAVKLGDRMVHGRMDRLEIHRLPQGATQIIVTDFKTDAVPREAVPTRAAHYGEQMRAYAEAVSVMLNVPLTSITARLLFVEPDSVYSFAFGNTETTRT